MIGTDTENDFIRLGTPAHSGEPLVTIDDVLPLRIVAEQDLYEVAGTRHVRTGGSADSRRCAKLFRSVDEFEIGHPDRYVSASSVTYNDSDLWRLIISVRTCRPSERHSSKFSHYKFEGMGDDLFDARKRVHVVRGIGSTAIDEHVGLVETVTTRRLSFERAMTSYDCHQLYGILSRSVRRARCA